MAQEGILSITLKDYKAQIDELKASMLGLSQTSDEYQQKANEAREMQEKLNQVLSDAKTIGAAAEGSYNALTKQMSELKKAWRATTDEAERKSIGAQINGINNQLKTLDASIGNYQRNVGNYANSFVQAGQAMGLMGGETAKAITLVAQLGPAIKGVSDAMKAAFSTNPYLLAIAVAIMAIVTAFEALKKGVTSSQENMNKWKQIIAPINGIITATTKGLQALASVLLDGISVAANVATAAFKALSEAVATVADFIGFDGYAESLRGVNKEIEVSIELEKKRQEIEEKELELIKEEADANLKISDLRAKANDREQYSLKQRKAFAKEAYEEEQKILKKKADIAKLNYELIKQENARAGNTKEATERENKAYAALQNALAALKSSERSYHQEQKAFNKEQTRNNNAASKAAKEKEKQEKEELDRKKKILEIEKAITDERNKQVVKGTELNYKNERDSIELNHKIQIENINKQFAKSSDKQKALYLEQVRYEAELNNLRIQHLEEASSLQLTESKRLANQLYGANGSQGQNQLKYLETLKEGYSNAYKTLDKIRTEFNDKETQLYNSLLQGMKNLPEEAQSALDIISDKLANASIKGEAAIPFVTALFKDVENITPMIAEMFKGLDIDVEAFQNLIPKDVLSEFQEVSYSVENLQTKINGLNEQMKDLADTNKRTTDLIHEETINKQILAVEEAYSRIPRYAADNAMIAYKEAVIINDNMYQKFGETADEFRVREIQAQQDVYDKRKAAFEAYMDDYLTLWDRVYEAQQSKQDIISESSELSQAEYAIQETEAELQALQQAYDAKLIMEEDYQKELARLRKQQISADFQYKNAIINTYTKMADGIASTMGTVANIMQANIKKKQENGKISEQEAKKEFERVKKLQISQAIINTISGSLGAFMQDKKAYAFPYNYIIGGIDMASTLAAGVAQITQIKNTSFGSESVGGGGANIGTASVSVDPLLNEQLDSNSLQSLEVQNGIEPQASDQKVYILQSDIDQSQKQVQIRENETTF